MHNNITWIYQKRREYYAILIYIIIPGMGTLLSVANILFLLDCGIIGIVCSLLWLLFIASVVKDELSGCGGFRMMIKQRISYIARKMSLDISCEGSVKVNKGYILLGKSWQIACIEATDSIGVSISMGIGSSRCGKDIGDWSLYIWDHRAIGLRQGIHIVECGSRLNAGIKLDELREWINVNIKSLRVVEATDVCQLYKIDKCTQQVDSAEASTIAVPPSEPSGSPR